MKNQRIPVNLRAGSVGSWWLSAVVIVTLVCLALVIALNPEARYHASADRPQSHLPTAATVDDLGNGWRLVSIQGVQFIYNEAQPYNLIPYK